MDRPKIDLEKIERDSHSANSYLDDKYGKETMPKREEFRAKALAFYYGEFIKEKRKSQHLTQQELAERIGVKRPYIAKVEKGETDIQLSSFLKVLQGLGLNLTIN
ncbi:XRE family transcriptional regulator [Pedobacter changchengzhani]|uniref:XRE family transcriptional regulator n=1 Tax=Pedobacter changchengzhani TaxID=2529274 RepID=A0A4V3A0A8_9SPHI|nr:helix-turn-helix transcriptional regulator [Pedobacter changchengzhani]TDG36883.1 XRE family transcriptional regulator [Pedobacter changchengzhani]